MPDESNASTYRQLGLVRSDRVNVGIVGSKQVQQPVPFLEPVIDGVRLRTLVEVAGYGDDFVTMLVPSGRRPALRTRRSSS